MSRISEIYLDIKSRLMGSGTPFKYFNLYNNQIQLALKAENYNFLSPAVFVEITFGEPFGLGMNFTSYPSFTVSLHIYHFYLNSDNMDKNLEIYEFRNYVKKWLNARNLPYCSSLIQVSETPDYSHNQVTKYTITFICNFIDNVGSWLDLGAQFATLVNPTLNQNIAKEWQANSNYFVGNIVSLLGVVYFCTEDNTDSEFDSEKWQSVEAWISEKSYVEFDYAMYESKIYRCDIDNSDLEFDPNKWILIS